MFQWDCLINFTHQLTGEYCKIVEDSRGGTKMVWEKIHDAVEALDCAVYILTL